MISFSEQISYLKKETDKIENSIYLRYIKAKSHREKIFKEFLNLSIEVDRLTDEYLKVINHRSKIEK